MKKTFTKIGYMIIGSLLTIIGYHFGSIDNNGINAEEDTPIVDEIQCRRLVVVGEDDTPRVVLSSGFFDGVEAGNIDVIGEGKLLSATIGSDAYGGNMAIFNRNQEFPVVHIATTKMGHGVVATRDKDGHLGNALGGAAGETVDLRPLKRQTRSQVSRGYTGPITLKNGDKILQTGNKIPPFNSDDCRVKIFITWDRSIIGEVENNKIVFPSDGTGKIILYDGTHYTSPKGCTIRDFTIISGSLIVNKLK